MRLRQMFTLRELWRLVLMLGLFCSIEATDVMAKGSSLTAQEREIYSAIAHRIFDRLVAAAHSQYPDLAALSSKSGSAHEEAKDKLWVAYHYSHGLSWIPNPNYTPG